MRCFMTRMTERNKCSIERMSEKMNGGVDVDDDISISTAAHTCVRQSGNQIEQNGESVHCTTVGSSASWLEYF